MFGGGGVREIVKTIRSSVSGDYMFCSREDCLIDCGAEGEGLIEDY